MQTLTYKTEGKNKYTVFWEHHLNGGGMSFGSEYPSVIKNLYPNRIFNTCFEWCSGPAFIGYNILDHEICKNLVLVDLFQPALDLALKTSEYNNLSDKVKVFNGNTVDVIPSNIKVDLVVANPPHYDRPYINDNSRIADDPNWEIHREFYNKISKYLSDDGVILIQENEDGSKPEMFYEMIASANLKVIDIVKSPNYYKTAPELIYYIHVVKNRG